MLNHQGIESAVIDSEGRELPLSNEAILKLMRSVLDEGVPFRFRAKGLSMSPFVRDNDIVTVSPLSNNSPRLGDVVAYIRPGNSRLVLHRVVEKRNANYIIKGDSAFQQNELIPKTHIIGYITGIERSNVKITLGLGPERLIIALLSRRGILLQFIAFIRAVIRPCRKRRIP